MRSQNADPSEAAGIVIMVDKVAAMIGAGKLAGLLNALLVPSVKGAVSSDVQDRLLPLQFLPSSIARSLDAVSWSLSD